MINIVNKIDCCGCCACVNSCPQNCIEMRVDNEGFVYPFINSNECINCNICERVCPILNNSEELKKTPPKGYIVQNKDDAVLMESTSGGAFTAIAKWIIKRNGVVFGVELQQDLYARPSAAHHVWIEKEDDLCRFRNSKYLQSFVGDNTLKQVRLFLEQGRYVCFSGTPCQIEGVKRYLDVQKTTQTKLVLVDVVCRAVPSPEIFRKYIEYQEKKYGEKIENVRFRDKFYGYKYSTMNVISDRNNGNYHLGVESDPWLRAFFSNICDRPSCHDCKFRKLHRVSDFTLWDCFHVGRFSKELDNDKGATRVLVHSDKAQRILDDLSNELKVLSVETERIIEGAKELSESVLPNPRRNVFFADAESLDGYSLFVKYFPLSFKTKIKRMIRMLAYRLGIYSIAKKAYVKLTGKY